MRAIKVKGMVQIGGTTYRVVRLEERHYEVIRILDDVRVGSFRKGEVLEVTEASIEPALLEMIARAAIHEAKTSWVGRVFPE